MKKISLVVPCYNEEGNVPEIYPKLTELMETLGRYDYEIVFSDNDSTDNTAQILREIAAKDKRVKVILNNRNFGHECSLFHAILKASGDAVIYLAADMQDPLELIPQFIERWENGALVVWGQKTGSTESKFMYWVRSLYYKIIKALSPIKQYQHVTGFGLYDRKLLEHFRNLCDPWPMLRNLVPYLGYKPELIPYKQAARKHGKSAHGFFKYFDTALNSLVHTSKVPLKIAIYGGFICSLLSFAAGLFYLIYKLVLWDNFEVGMAPVVIAVFFLASVQITFMGVMGEYILNILDRASFREYVIEKETINFEADA